MRFWQVVIPAKTPPFIRNGSYYGSFVGVKVAVAAGFVAVSDGPGVLVLGKEVLVVVGTGVAIFTGITNFCPSTNLLGSVSLFWFTIASWVLLNCSAKARKVSLGWTVYSNNVPGGSLLTSTGVTVGSVCPGAGIKIV